jgi:hypothetical protein
MSGISLGELSASDMVDVLHYLFEEDMNYVSAEQAEAKSKTRENLYSTMYNMTYKYAYKSNNTNKNEFIDPDTIPTEDGPTLDDIKPFNPKEQPTKAYVPPTDFNPGAANPFMGTLDAPMK